MAQRALPKTTAAPRARAQRKPAATTKTVAVPKSLLKAAPSTIDIEVPVDNSVLHFSSDVNPEDNPFSEREPVFTFDGKEYTAPVRVPASWGLAYARNTFLNGNDFAIVWALEVAMGTEAVDKLTKIPDLDPSQLTMITTKITDKFLAATTDPKDISESE